MDNLMLFYPLIVLLFFIFFDVRNRKNGLHRRRSNNRPIGRLKARKAGRSAITKKTLTKIQCRGM